MEPCRRCDGKGTVVYQVGKPGQDRRVIPYVDIKWEDPTTARCPVCLGMKVQQPKRNYPPPRTEIYWSTPLTEEERAELFTTEVPPPDVYDKEQ